MLVRPLVVLLLAALASVEQTALDDRVARAASRLAADVPGLSVAVVIEGKPVFSKGFGRRSVDTAAPVDGDTQYRLASVSKTVTAVAVLKLVEQGGVDLDRQAREYCPVLAGLNAAPTVRHFLLHQSGMRHTTDEEDERITVAPPSLGASLERVVKERLAFAPGQRTLYTSWGYTALGCLIETVSGQTYAEFVTRHVLGPAGMRDTAFDEPRYASPTFSPGFRMVSGRLQPSVVVDTRFKRPSSGIISTVNDLARLATALFDGRLLPAPLFREMLTTRPAPGDERPMFTPGWIVGPGNLGTPGFNYGGSMEGTTAYLGILPERRVAVALLANRERFVPGVLPVVNEAFRAALASR
jgi:CubicO group peptidase (beta-lactamase class C family)